MANVQIWEKKQSWQNGAKRSGEATEASWDLNFFMAAAPSYVRYISKGGEAIIIFGFSCLAASPASVVQGHEEEVDDSRIHAT